MQCYNSRLAAVFRTVSACTISANAGWRLSTMTRLNSALCLPTKGWKPTDDNQSQQCTLHVMLVDQNQWCTLSLLHENPLTMTRINGVLFHCCMKVHWQWSESTAHSAYQWISKSHWQWSGSSVHSICHAGWKSTDNDQNQQCSPPNGPLTKIRIASARCLLYWIQRQWPESMMHFINAWWRSTESSQPPEPLWTHSGIKNKSGIRVH